MSICFIRQSIPLKSFLELKKREIKHMSENKFLYNKRKYIFKTLQRKRNDR